MTDHLGRKNRRWHPRIGWNSAIKFRPKASGGEWELSRFKDVSLGGCAFNSNVPYDLGEVIEIEIRSNLLNGKVLFLGTVKRCFINDPTESKKYSIAIHFVEVIEEADNDFLDMIQSLMRKSDIN